MSERSQLIETEINLLIIDGRRLSVQPASSRRLSGVDSECAELHHHAGPRRADTGVGEVSGTPAEHHHTPSRVLQLHRDVDAVAADHGEARWVLEPSQRLEVKGNVICDGFMVKIPSGLVVSFKFATFQLVELLKNSDKLYSGLEVCATIDLSMLVNIRASFCNL